MAQSKIKEKQTAKLYFVEQGKTAKEIADIVKVSQQTVGKWIEQENWKNLRTATALQGDKQIANIKEIINIAAEQRLELAAKLKNTPTNDTQTREAIHKQINQADNSALYWNKILENFDKENRISLSVYITVQERIFNALYMYLDTEFSTEQITATERKRITEIVVDFETQHVISTAKTF